MAKKLCSPYLPEDIIFQLLVLLPVRSLLRFKLVCKSWRSIISDRQFVEAHRKQASSLNNTVLVVEFAGFENHYLVSSRNSTDDIVTGTRVQLPPQFNGKTRFLDHCNGLVCVSDLRRNVIYLWNPSTKLYKVLPNPKIRRAAVNGPLMLGFGFDSFSHDYKVLRSELARAVGPPDGKFRFVQKAEMYSANADSWKEIQVPAMVKIYAHVHRPCFHSETGALYFQGYNDILRFDLHNEVLGLYMFPETMRSYRKSDILDFKGSVAMITWTLDDGNRSIYSLWTLLDDGCGPCGQVSWTKKFNFAPDLDFSKSRVCCFLGSTGHFAAVLNGVGEFKLYDCYKKKEIQVHLPVAKADGEHSTWVVKFTESLFHSKGLNIWSKMIST